MKPNNRPSQKKVGFFAISGRSLGRIADDGDHIGSFPPKSGSFLHKSQMGGA